MKLPIDEVTGILRRESKGFVIRLCFCCLVCSGVFMFIRELSKKSEG